MVSSEVQEHKEYQVTKATVMIRRILFLTALFIVISCSGDRKEKLYTGMVEFPVKPTQGVKEAMSARVVPSQRQLEWQKLEMTAFVHFSLNTFTDKEWGSGDDSPELFNPCCLDAGQWVRILKEAGMKMVIITAKHHDGFCLWPTSTTDYSVASSPWKEGKGDVVKELREACTENEMKFGVYLSPWDRNASCYSDSAEYNAFYMQQLSELLTNYGRVDEVWFDGAADQSLGNKSGYYNWSAWYALVRRLQPEAVIAVMGEDIRWIGTESGCGRESEWSVTALAPGGTIESRMINTALGIDPASVDLGSSELLQQAGRVFWYPAEADVSIRPGWFWHSSEDSLVKDINALSEIYLNTVGRNAVLLLNVPPDNRGLITDRDKESLLALKSWIDRLYDNDLLNGSRPYGSGASRATDNDNRTSWHPSGHMVATFVPAITATFNVAMLQEDISRGQRVEKFCIEARTGEQWDTVASGTTIGYKRLLRFPDTKADEVRLTINSSRARPYISTFALYRITEND